MAIKIKDKEGYVYLGLKDRIFTQDEKKRADIIYEDSADKLKNIKNANDLLQLWLLRGKIANTLHGKYNIQPHEEIYFWEMLYDAAGIKLPDRSKNILARNEFWLGSRINSYLPIKNQWLNNWTVWRELFEAKSIKEDPRTAEWIVRKAIEMKLKNRNDMRVLLNKVRNRLKNIDTLVLKKQELFTKLDETI